MPVTLLASRVLHDSRKAACFTADKALRDRVQSLQTFVCVAGRTSSI